MCTRLPQVGPVGWVLDAESVARSMMDGQEGSKPIPRCSKILQSVEDHTTAIERGAGIQCRKHTGKGRRGAANERVLWLWMTTPSQMAFGLLKLRSTHSSRSPLTNREHTAIREVFSYWLVQGQGVAGSEMSARAVQVAPFSLRLRPPHRNPRHISSPSGSASGSASPHHPIHHRPPRRLSTRPPVTRPRGGPASRV